MIHAYYPREPWESYQEPLGLGIARVGLGAISGLTEAIEKINREKQERERLQFQEARLRRQEELARVRSEREGRVQAERLEMDRAEHEALMRPIGIYTGEELPGATESGGPLYGSEEMPLMAAREALPIYRYHQSLRAEPYERERAGQGIRREDWEYGQDVDPESLRNREAAAGLARILQTIEESKARLAGMGETGGTEEPSAWQGYRERKETEDRIEDNLEQARNALLDYQQSIRIYGEQPGNDQEAAIVERRRSEADTWLRRVEASMPNYKTVIEPAEASILGAPTQEIAKKRFETLLDHPDLLDAEKQFMAAVWWPQIYALPRDPGRVEFETHGNPLLEIFRDAGLLGQ